MINLQCFCAKLISFFCSPHSCDPVLGPAAAVWHFSSPESQYFFHLNHVSFKADSKMSHKTAPNLWEVHGISGPVVHQFMEVIGEGAFPLVGGWHIRGQTLGTPLALTQTRTTHCIGAIRPCRGRRERGQKSRWGFLCLELNLINLLSGWEWGSRFNHYKDCYRMTAAAVLGHIRMLSWAENHTVKSYHHDTNDGWQECERMTGNYILQLNLFSVWS